MLQYSQKNTWIGVFGLHFRKFGLILHPKFIVKDELGKHQNYNR